MTLQQLRYFLAACQHGSFSAAADALYIAQPSLADQVRRLEAELGVRLFVRSGRRLILTDAGQTLEPHALSALQMAEAAVASVGDVRELRNGTASLGTFGIAHRYLVADVVAEFAARHPDVKLRVVGQNTVEVCDLIRSGQLEAGLVTMPFDATGLDVEPAMTEENLYAAVDPGPEGMDIGRFSRQRLIFYDAHFGWQDPTRGQLAERARAAGVELRPAIEVETFEAALGLAAQGLGGTFVLRTVADSPSFPTTLNVVPFDPPLYDTFAFASQRGARLSAATQELIRLTKRQIAGFARPAGSAQGPPCPT